MGCVYISCQKEGGQTPPPRLGLFDDEILDYLRHGGEVCPGFHHLSFQKIPMPSPWNGPIENVDEDGRGDLGGRVIGRYMGCNYVLFMYFIVWLYNTRKYGRVTENY